MDFLSAFSYELTYKMQAKRFSELDLVDCYKKICQKFRLPEDQAIEVAREIETHTGIIAVASKFTFEFTHLSLQEYLCANYIVREPRAGQIPNYIRVYPAPLAVAIALASEPSTWFADFILTYGDTRYFDERALQIFVARLIDEKPRFVPSSSLGLSILQLFFNFYEHGNSELRTHLELLTKLPYVLDSISLGLEPYWIEKNRSESSDYFYLVHQHDVSDMSTGYELSIRPPLQGRLKKKILLQALQRSKFNMYWCEKWGMSGSRFHFEGDSYSYE
jgi:hypothetical protein